MGRDRGRGAAWPGRRGGQRATGSQSEPPAPGRMTCGRRRFWSAGSRWPPRPRSAPSVTHIHARAFMDASGSQPRAPALPRPPRARPGPLPRAPPWLPAQPPATPPHQPRASGSLRSSAVRAPKRFWLRIWCARASCRVSIPQPRAPFGVRRSPLLLSESVPAQPQRGWMPPFRVHRTPCTDLSRA